MIISACGFWQTLLLADVFREIGLADELGRGMRNTYKYTKLYSGGVPEFEEGDMFITRIPLTVAATGVKVGPVTSPVASGEVGGEVSGEVRNTAVSIRLDIQILNDLLDFCKEPRSRSEMQAFCGIRSQDYFRKHVLLPLLEIGKIRRTVPDKPNSSKQKYVRTGLS